MTLLQFAEKSLGKATDFDGAYGAQCVDLFRQYAQDVWNIKGYDAASGVEGAQNLATAMNLKLINKVSKGGEGPGDVLVWGSTATNKYGHVAIMLAPIGDKFIVIDQNGNANGGKGEAARLNIRSRDNLLGAFRKK